MGYSTTPNIAKIIAAKNAKVLKPPEEDKPKCNCPKTKECPLDKKCLSEKLIYQATVTVPNLETQTYIGQCSTSFKARLGVHNQTFRDPEVSQTTLSNHIH